jgi:hypothetical protein
MYVCVGWFVPKVLIICGIPPKMLMHACMRENEYVCMYVCMCENEYVCMHACMRENEYVCMYVCVRLFVQNVLIICGIPPAICMYACMRGNEYACMYVCAGSSQRFS